MAVSKAISGDKISVSVQLRELRGKGWKTNTIVLNYNKISQNVTGPAGPGNDCPGTQSHYSLQVSISEHKSSVFVQISSFLIYSHPLYSIYVLLFQYMKKLPPFPLSKVEDRRT
jgi:hypothetical protein